MAKLVQKKKDKYKLTLNEEELVALSTLFYHTIVTNNGVYGIDVALDEFGVEKIGSLQLDEGLNEIKYIAPA